MVFQCPKCQLKFRFPTELYNHLGSDHPSFHVRARTVEDDLLTASHRPRHELVPIPLRMIPTEFGPTPAPKSLPDLSGTASNGSRIGPAHRQTHPQVGALVGPACLGGRGAWVSGAGRDDGHLFPDWS